MIIKIMLCAIALNGPMTECPDSTILSENTTDTCTVILQEEVRKEPDEKFWAKKKTHRIGYDFHTLQYAEGAQIPARFSLGYSRVKNLWLHKQPIAGMIKFSFDRGIDLNYSMLDTGFEDTSYNGPQGFIGNVTDDSEPSDGEEDGFDIASIGSHYFSLGYALGASVTVNPVAKLRINGYVHFVPSVAMQLSGPGMSLNLGFMPYVKYGAEVTYNWFGIGAEWGTGASNMSDMLAKMMSEQENATAPETKFYSNYMRVYMAFKLGKPKKKKK